MVTGRQKILARYRSYHGGNGRRHHATGDPRRWAAEPGVPGVVRVPDPYHCGNQRGSDPVGRALADLEEVILFEGPHTIAAFILETVTGTNGILIPPDGYLQGVRELCDKLRHPAHRRRGHVRLRPHRANGSRSTTGTWCRT